MNIKGKKILVTGGKGFLGQAVTRELHRRGALTKPLSSRDGGLHVGCAAEALTRVMIPEALDYPV